MKDRKDYKCQNQCSRMEEVMKYANKNKNDALALKEISESQKVKITCLRGHRNELLDKIDTLNEKQENEIKEKDDIIANTKEEVVASRATASDLQDEIALKTSEIECLIREKEGKEALKMSSHSLKDELGMANAHMEKKNLEHKVELMEGLITKSKDFYIFY